MSIEKTDIIDALSIDSSDEVVLTISDHLSWEEEQSHLMLLQSKINAYLNFIESGGIYEQYPPAKGRHLKIGIAFKFLPKESGIDFLKKVRFLCLSSGYDLYYYQLDD